MISKRIATACVMAALAMGPSAPVFADVRDGIVGGIIGGIIGGAIVAESQKKKKTTAGGGTTTRSTGSSQSAAQREANREVQVALNYFGYPVGTPDGALGPKSRAAISEYQVLLGYAPTGQLTEFERTHLVASYHRAIAGGEHTAALAAGHSLGTRGLLLQWRDEAARTPGGVMAAGQPDPTDPFGTTEAEPVIALPDLGGGLPTFMGAEVHAAALSGHCNDVSLKTSSNGGFATAESMTDPMLALNEQFCVARAQAISQGQELVSRLQGVTPEQVAAQCAGFGPTMAAPVAALSMQPVEEVLSAARAIAAGSGMAPAQLSGSAKVCLSVGYQQDQLDVAMGSALILAALGEAAYGELMGHHLAQGIGAVQRPDLALGWFEFSVDGVSAGGIPVFGVGQQQRADLIRKAAYSAAGQDDPTALDMATDPVFIITPIEPEEGTIALAPDTGEAETEAIMASDSAPGAGASKMGALPLAAQLPFLLFRN